MVLKRLVAFRIFIVSSSIIAAVMVGLLLCPDHLHKSVSAKHCSGKGITDKNAESLEESANAKSSIHRGKNQTCFRERIENPAENARPLVVHLIVALCDNKHQGIVPVPEQLGNGQDPRNNLYWGAMYGVRAFLTRSAAWEIVGQLSDRPRDVLEKLVFHTTVQRSGREVDVYLVAEAWDGAEIKSAIERFVWMAGGRKTETVRLRGSNGFQELQVGGAAHLVAYVGHNGLMDFSLTNLPREPSSARRPSAIVLACRSKPYFLELLRQAGAHSLLLTTGLMAPEAYTLDAAVKSWASGEEPYQVRDRAAAAYDKYQKCGVEAARRLFYFESYSQD